MSEDSRKQIYHHLDTHQVDYQVHEHHPIFTVREAQEHTAHIPGIDAKTLLVKGEKSKKHYLISLEGNARLDQKRVKELVGERVRFADSQSLSSLLRTYPGSVSPLGLIFDTTQTIACYLIDQAILDSDIVTFHPNINTQTCEFTQSNFAHFLDSLPHSVISY